MGDKLHKLPTINEAAEYTVVAANQADAPENKTLPPPQNMRESDC